MHYTFFSFLFKFRGRCPVPAPVSDCHFTWQSDSSTELWFHPWLSGTDWVYVDNGQGIKPESRDKYPPSQEVMDDHLRWKAPRIMYAWFRKQLCGRLVEELYQYTSFLTHFPVLQTAGHALVSVISVQWQGVITGGVFIHVCVNIVWHRVSTVKQLFRSYAMKTFRKKKIPPPPK